MKIILKILILIFFLLSAGLINLLKGQAAETLKSQISETNHIDRKIELLTRLAKQYLNQNPDSAMFYSKQALALAKSARIDQYSSDAYAIIGDVLVVKDSLDLAERFYDTALVLFEKYDNAFEVTGVLTVLGNINVVKENTSKALQYYLQALKISKEHNIHGRLPYLYLNIGTIYFNANDTGKAQDYYLDALKGFEQVNDSLNMARVLSSLGGIYSKLNETELAGDYYERALKIFKKLNSPADIAECYVNIAEVEKKKGAFEKALEYLQISREKINEIDYSYAGPRFNILARVEEKLGENYLMLGEIKKAKQYLKKGFDLAENNSLVSVARDASGNLSALYEQTGRYDSALFYYKIFKARSEELINEENIKKLASIEARNEYERQIEEQQRKRVAEVKAQHRRNIVYIIVIVILVLLALLLLLFLKLGKTRAARSELEKKNLQNELELRNKELTIHVMTQLKKNEFILEISKKLEKTLSAAHPENKPIIERVIKELESEDSKEVWKEFELRFQNVHSDFYKNLVQKFPDLTANELRLCAFIKLNLNSKEISSITHQSVNSIDVARSRLRQKLGLTKEDNLTSFLAGI